MKNSNLRDKRLEEHALTLKTFNSIFDEEQHNALVQRGDRRFSHKAMQV